MNNYLVAKKAESENFSWLDLGRAYYFLFGEQRKAYIVWQSALFVLLLYDIVPPLIISKTVDFFTDYSAGQSLVPFYLLATLLGVSMALVSFLRLSVKRVMNNTRNEASYHIRVSGFERLLALSLTEHANENSGAKDQRIQSGIAAFKDFAMNLDNRLLPTLATVIGIFAVFLSMDLKYNAVLVTYLIGSILIVAHYRKRLSVLSDEKNKALEKSSGAFIEGLGNVMTIKSSGAEENFKTSVAKKEAIRRSYDHKLIIVSNNLWKTYQFFNSAYAGLFLFAVGHDVAVGAITVGSIVLLFTYLQKLIGSTSQIVDVYGNLITIKATIARLMGIFWTGEEIRDGELGFPQDWQELVLTKACYAYKNDANPRTNIDCIDLRIKRNEKVGIIGTTGSGKSTLAKLLLGLYLLDKGSYRIGDVVFGDIRRDEVFRHMAIVLQESEMFNIPLRENIALSEEVDEEKLARAIRISQLEEVVAALPDGLDTLIGEKGYHLSGGERQRVGIARAIYRDPEIIIFDEATSSLDVETERRIQEALLDNLQQKTLIIVAHRTNTLEKVDVIYKVEDGRIVANGSYKDYFST